MEDSGVKPDHGTSSLCPAPLRVERIPWTRRLLPSPRGRSRGRGGDSGQHFGNGTGFRRPASRPRPNPWGLAGAAHPRRTLPEEYRLCRRRLRYLQRIRKLVLALPKRLRLSEAPAQPDSARSRPGNHWYWGRLEPDHCSHSLACGVLGRDRRRFDWIWLPREGSDSHAWGARATVVQRHLWAAHLRSAALCRERVHGGSGLTAPEGRLSSDDPRPSRPVDPLTNSPLPLRGQPGYYPNFHTLDQQDFWDAATRSVVLDRVNNVPPLRFFQEDELALARALFDRLIPQDDREPAFRIPVLNYVDDRLQQNRLDGYRYEGMPPDQEAYHLGLRGIDEIARHLHGRPFSQCALREQEEILQTIHDGDPPAGDDVWRRMSVERFWLLIMQDAVEGYYAHPWAWDEIGFGGPAYPRAYF